MEYLNISLTKKNGQSLLDPERIKEKALIRVLQPADLQNILNLQELVYNTLPNKRVLVTDTESEIKSALNGKGLILGVETANHNELVAYRFVSYVEANDSYHLGTDIGLGIEQRERAVHLETTLVLPSYRGNGLQRLTLQVAQDHLIKKGYEHVLCTVSPFNPYSLYNVMSEGLHIKSLKKKYGDKLDRNQGLWRFILYKDLVRNTDYALERAALSPMEDLSLQRFLLRRGYIGIKMSSNSSHIQYAQLL